MIKKWQNALVIFALAVSITLILWLTLFSRLGSDSRHFYPPFWSYRAILNGSGEAILENIGNIVLFIPVGIIAALFLKLNLRWSLLIGFTVSLVIECCQWFFWLGSFEIDDLIHNSIGAGIGAVLVNRTPLGTYFKLENQRKSLAALLLLTVLVISSCFVYQNLKWQQMKRLAALNDREDGTKNLLILSPDPKYIGETDFHVSYHSDGRILIEGSSDNRAWIEIGRLTLEAGTYSFSGLSGAEEKTVAIQTEYYDEKNGNYYWLTPEIGHIDRAVFSVDSITIVRVLIVLHPNTKGSYYARPALYKENTN